MANNALLPAKGKKKKKQAIPNSTTDNSLCGSLRKWYNAGRTWIIFQNIRI